MKYFLKVVDLKLSQLIKWSKNKKASCGRRYLLWSL